MIALSSPAFIIIVVTAMIILIFRDWRINAGALALQYIAVFILVSLSWPIGVAITKLIVGWMATAAIALTCMRQIPSEAPSEPTASLFFRGLAGLLVIMVIFVLAPSLQASMFPRLNLFIVQGGTMLIGMALMQMGTNAEPYLTIFSLLSFLAGFEVIHAGLELSTLLTGLMAIVNLSLALIGVYFIIKANENKSVSEEER
jgi:hypothetical protein